MNKKLLLTGLVLFGLSVSAFAAPKRRQNGVFMNDAGQFVSQAVYIGHSSCATQALIFIATRPAFLYGIDIGSVSTGGGFTMEVFDASASTSVNVLRVARKIVTNTNRFYPFNVGLSSGLAIDLRGTDTPCWTAFYYEK